MIEKLFAKEILIRATEGMARKTLNQMKEKFNK